MYFFIMKYLISIVLFLSACSTEQVKNKSFISVSDSTKVSNSRAFHNLTEVKRINLNEFDFFYVLQLEQNDNSLFIRNGNNYQILVVDKNSPDKNYILDFSEGRGPGELLQMSEYDIYKNRIFVVDNSQSKISIFDLSGELIKEFRISNINVDRLEVINEELLLVYTMQTSEYVFNIISIEGDVVESFVESEPKLHYLQYSGDIYYANGDVYFFGYSEPIMKKYNLDTEQLSYSKYVVNNYDPSANYVRNEIGEIIASGYSPAALYSSVGFSVYDNEIFNAVYHNGEEGHKYMDVYNSNTGTYIRSYELGSYPSLYGIQADSENIYSLEEDTSNVNWLIYYLKD